MNYVNARVDVDAHLYCACCKGMTAASQNILKLEQGKIEYIQSLDLNAFDPDQNGEYHICEVCTLESYSLLIDEWDEAEEITIETGMVVALDDASWVTEYFFSSEDVPRTWFCESEPDQCLSCGESHDTGDDVVQISVVQREGRRFSDPIPQPRSPGMRNRYTWFCKGCVSEFYKHVRS